MRHYGDITKLSGYDLPAVDCITGGSPCQDLSIAGLRAGIGGKRSGLFLHQIRIVKEMRQRDRSNGRTGVFVRPRFMVWENVPGSFSSNKGRDFQKVLSEIVRIAEPEAPDVPMPPRGGGRIADASTMRWVDGALLGDFTMLNFGESPSEENVSQLLRILEDEPHPKYSLSTKACLGILNRAKRRKKVIPPMLEMALVLQSQSKETP